MDELLQLASPTTLPLTPDDIMLDCTEYVSFDDLIIVELSEHWLPEGHRGGVDYSFKHNIFMHFTERKLEDFNQ